MKPEKPPGQWSTSAAARDRLLLADPTRVAEFCDLYESERIDDGMRLFLMELIIFSSDEEYKDPDYRFPVTPMMRGIWKDYFRSEYQPWIIEAEVE